jgi:hypothetical protein
MTPSYGQTLKTSTTHYIDLYANLLNQNEVLVVYVLPPKPHLFYPSPGISPEVHLYH